MKYHNLISGKFIKRVNRFIAHVLVDNAEQIVHVKNTGRCKELLIPGVDVILEKSNNPGRKTQFSLIGVYKGNRLINIDSQVPTQVVFEALASGAIQELGTVEKIKKEVTYGSSRFDIYFESGGKQGFIEVKGVTLENAGVAMFPDAPTTRGARHVYEMIEAVKNGYAGYIFFLIQMKEVGYFTPNKHTDPEFTKALSLAAKKGVKILAYDSIVSRDAILLGDKVDIRL